MFGLTGLETGLTGAVVALLGAFGVKDILLKKITSKKEEVENESFAIKTMKEVLITATSSQSDVSKMFTENAVLLKTELAEIRGRVESLEERERHMLTRAAIHEAWDQIAFSMLLSQNPDHPPPPPLIIFESENEDNDNGS